MSFRGEHHKPLPGTAAYDQGQRQAKLSITRYHMLCAALKKQFTTVDTPRNAHGGYLPGHGFDETSGRMNVDPTVLDIWTRQTIDFHAYEDFSLEPVPGVKLHPREDGSIHPGDLEMYRSNFEDNWKTLEGGILYCLAEYRAFFNCLSNYHSPKGTTGMPEWDDLFERLKTTGYPKDIIPCMFFGRESGCLDGACPFLHNREAVLQSRAVVIEKRRATFDGRPTPRQTFNRQKLIVGLEAGHDRQRRAEVSREVEKFTEGDRAYCANPECLKPWKQSDATCPLQRCQRCRFALYCSVECQKKDWKRHKDEPCAPIEQLIENDDLWNILGTRKGTEMVNVDWGSA